MYLLFLFQIDKPTNQAAGDNDKPPIQASLFAHTKYKENSQDQRSKEEAIAQWVAKAAQPSRAVEHEEFVKMIEKMDIKVTVPKKTKVKNLIDKIYLAEKDKFKQRLFNARKISIGLDIWTKKGFTASFLAITACYYNSVENKAEHILLNLKQMAHPHTAHSIATLVEESTTEWEIPREKILTIITDNGSNMVAAFRHDEEGTDSEEESSSSEEDRLQDSDEEGEDLHVDESLERSVYKHDVCWD